MTINTEDLLNSILESVGRIDYIHPVDIPNIDLYMDQVTTFMEKNLSSTKRYEEDKILFSMSFVSIVIISPRYKHYIVFKTRWQDLF